MYAEPDVYLHCGYGIDTDGNLIPAEIHYAGYLLTCGAKGKGKLLEIMQMFGLQEIRDYYEYLGDYDAMVFRVRPDMIELLREMFMRIREQSKLFKEEDEREWQQGEEMRKAAQAPLDALLKDLGGGD